MLIFELQVSLGVSVSFITSVVFLIKSWTTPYNPHGSHDDKKKIHVTYFDTVVFLTFFLLIGRLLESVSKAKTACEVDVLAKLRPSEVTVFIDPSDDYNDAETPITPISDSSDDGLESNQPKGRTAVVSVDLVDVGDIIVVALGESSPADGTVVYGNTTFDESSLTGESIPVQKCPGDKVLAGTINKQQPIRVRIEATAGQSM